MNKTHVNCLLGIVMIGLVACQNNIHNLKEYYAYINAPKHGLIKEKSIGDMKFTLKYWPAAAAIQQDYNQGTITDSLQQLYENNLTFILKIEASEQAAEAFDVMTQTVSSLQEYKEQALTMNFKWQELLSMNIESKTVSPVLAVLENTYGLQQYRLVNVVFAREDCMEQGILPEQLDLVFMDKIFGTGKHHFVFYTKDLEAIPLLDL